MTHNGTFNINAETVIGDNCNIGVGTLIGQENRGNRKGCPTIGNCVWIGANCSIVGRITIGDDVLIAPNSFVNFDIPPHSVVVGGRIIAKDNATESYCTNVFEI